MKGLIKIITAVLVCGSLSAHGQTLKPIEWSYAYILATNTSHASINSVARAVGKETEVTSTEFLDLVAEILWERAEDSAVDKEARKGLWYLLHESGKSRYKKVLIETAEAVGGDAKDLGKVIRRKNRKTDLNSSGIYQRGTISLNALRQQYIDSSLKAVVPDARAMPISKLELGRTAGEVFKIMGYPQAVLIASTENPITLKIFRMTLLYRGQGVVVLQKRLTLSSGDPREAEILWWADKIVEDPLSYEIDMPYVDLAANEDANKRNVYMNILLYGDALSLKRLMEKLHRSTAADVEILDVAAQRLADEYLTSREEDALAWVCKVLTLHGAGRYSALLREVRKKAPGYKLRQYAGLARSKHKTPVVQFEAGKMDFAALKQKYPPLYPGTERKERSDEPEQAQVGDGQEP